MKKVNKSLWLPAVLLVYLAVIIVVYGLPHLRAGEDLLFYGVSCGSLVVIALLHLVLRKKERRTPRDTYGPYPKHPTDSDDAGHGKTE